MFHKSGYRERRNHFAYFACSAELAGFDTQREAFLGPYRGWDRPLVVEEGRSRDSIACGWAPCGSHHVELAARIRGRAETSSSSSATPRTRSEAKFDPPGSADDRQARRDAGDRALPRSRGRRAGARAPARPLVGPARNVPGGDAERPRRPDGQRLEPVPVHDHVQPLALGLAVRVRHRARAGLPRLESGPARVRASRSRAGARAASRPGRDTASLGRRLPPVPAADEARERRDRLRVQRRPALADPGDGRLPEGDRRRDDPAGAGPVRQRAWHGDAAVRASPAARSGTRSTGSARTGCR